MDQVIGAYSSPQASEKADLPEFPADSHFHFECGPQVPCFNRCCSDVAIPLTPYDVARIRRNLDISSEKFLLTFTERITIPETGTILPMLKMIQSPDAPCPFTSPAGCSIYADRPGACRSWPLGIGTSIGENGIQRRYYLIKETFCQGFCSSRIYTPLDWQDHEGMKPYNDFNDKYVLFLSKISASGRPLDKRLANLCFLALYQLDRFRELIVKMRIFARVELDISSQEAIMQEQLEGDTACLNFALSWLELAIFAHSPSLRKTI